MISNIAGADAKPLGNLDLKTPEQEKDNLKTNSEAPPITAETDTEEDDEETRAVQSRYVGNNLDLIA
ncbi:MAG: hypothetical protein JKX97_08410 [Candidatus Lindowbacteria bacterium]|nr:hypothetical protein [Candidatus Lindowbacteria bacterium]